MIYISGKISGLEMKDVEIKFYSSVDMLYRNGFKKVVNPLKIKPLFNIRLWIFHIIADLYYLSKCDAVYFQKDWKESTGAKIEMLFSLLTFKTIYYES